VEGNYPGVFCRTSLNADGPRIDALGASIFSRAPRNPASTNRPGSQNRIVMITKGRGYLTLYETLLRIEVRRCLSFIPFLVNRTWQIVSAHSDLRQPHSARVRALGARVVMDAVYG